MPEQPSIARDVFLLLTREKDGVDTSGTRKQAVLAGAVIDLVLAGGIVLEEGRNPRIRVADVPPTGDVVLEDLRERLAPFDGKRISSLFSTSKLDLTETVGQDLVDAGALERRKGWVFTYWPEAAEGAHFERNLREHLGRVLRGEETASPHDGAELGLLKAVSQSHPQLKDQVPGWKRRDLDTRIDQIAAERGSSPVVAQAKAAIEASMLAVQTALMAATITTTST